MGPRARTATLGCDDGRGGMSVITTTHVTMSGAVSRLAASDGDGPAARVARRLLPDGATRRAILWGGLAPDIGLAALSAGALVWFPLVEGRTVDATFDHVYRDLFYEDPVWVVGHNTLHAPPVLVVLLLVGLRLRGPLGRWLAAFAVGCLLHSVVDILTHHDDGPLLLFPFDWSTRFISPVSYWDPAHGGRVLGPIDVAITVLGGGWLASTWWRGRRGDEWSAPPT